jgi:hypothetical protein
VLFGRSFNTIVLANFSDFVTANAGDTFFCRSGLPSDTTGGGVLWRGLFGLGLESVATTIDGDDFGVMEQSI